MEETPNKGANKREASSPPYSEAVTLKKNRHKPTIQEMSSIFEAETTSTATCDVSKMGDITQVNTGDGDVVHLISQPMEASDIVQIASELRSLMRPELKSLIQEFSPTIKEVVKEAMQEVAREIGELKTSNQRLTKANEDLLRKNKELEKRVEEIELGNDALEQYSRRNSLRISGIPELPGESRDELVLKLAGDLDVQLIDSDIDRSHRVGRPRDRQTSGRPRHRDILVKFATYNARRRLVNVRKSLRDRQDMKHIYINEDLIKTRSKMMYDARCLVRVGQLKSAYVSDGKIFIRNNQEERRLIACAGDLLAYGDPREAREGLTGRHHPASPSRARPSTSQWT